MNMFSIALVSDLIEENWPSMDLVADMLFSHLHTSDPSVRVHKLRPAMRRRLSRFHSIAPSRIVRNSERLLNRFHDYPSWLGLRASDYDLFHVVDHSYAQLVHDLPAERTIVSCHDLDTFRCLLGSPAEKRSPPFRWMTRRILQGVSKAAHVLCVSQTVRGELIRSGLLPAERVSTVPNGVHPSCSALPELIPDIEAERLLSHKDGAIYLLHVGSTIPRKRIDTLLQIFARVRRALPSTKLIRVGGGFTESQKELARQLEIWNEIIVLPFLERSTLAAVYRRAALLLLTSDAEGFGLPLVEALACNCPVVASDIPVLREVGGAAAEFCPIADPAVWSETVIELLRKRRRDPDAWERRCKAGREQAAQFTWEKSATRCLEIYKKVLKGSHSQ
jgi:glycosyltransferase involved in cell wall biosynthesis